MGQGHNFKMMMLRVEREGPRRSDESLSDWIQRVLTPAELRVCSLMAANWEFEDIAVKQSISVKTVDMHAYNARKKLGIRAWRKRIDLVVLFLRAKLIAVEDLKLPEYDPSRLDSLPSR